MFPGFLDQKFLNFNSHNGMVHKGLSETGLDSSNILGMIEEKSGAPIRPL